jgi:clan AA aspartic protease (TIGR02281 family)
MRRLFLACLIALSAGAADAASLDPSRIAAIDQAADAFLARAVEVRKSAQVPRQSDPAIGQLLDTMFNTDDLSHGPVPLAELDKLDDWLARIVKVGTVYVAAARSVHDFGLFGMEIGRFVDASVVVERAMADSVMAELDAHPGENPASDDAKKLARLRAAMLGSLNETLALFHAPGLTVGWVRARLLALTATAPSLARFLAPDDLARLRAAIARLEMEVRDKTVRTSLAILAEALAEPRAPSTAPATAMSHDEIALEHDGHGYSVPVQINGALTVKFVVDSGAGTVALPSDLVEQLTKSGAIAPGDSLGKGDYVTADGKKHHEQQLMLRELNVGGHIVTNVIAGVIPAHATPLLGQTFLAKFKSWTLDNRRHVLAISE